MEVLRIWIDFGVLTFFPMILSTLIFRFSTMINWSFFSFCLGGLWHELPWLLLKYIYGFLIQRLGPLYRWSISSIFDSSPLYYAASWQLYCCRSNIELVIWVPFCRRYNNHWVKEIQIVLRLFQLDFIWVISTKSGLNPDRISPPSSSAIIHRPPAFVLDLLPSDAITRILFCRMKLMSGSAVASSL